MARDSVVVHGRGSTNIVRTHGNHRWASLSLSHDDLAVAGEAIAGRDVICPSDTQLIAPSHAMLTGTRGHSISDSQDGLNITGNSYPPAVAKALEQKIIRALVMSLAVRSATGAPMATGTACPDRQPLPGIPRIAVGRARLSRRDLWGDRRFRAHAAHMLSGSVGRRSCPLSLAAPDASGTASAAACRYFGGKRHRGRDRARIWELGRFSVEYRTLFGELPFGVAASTVRTNAHRFPPFASPSATKWRARLGIVGYYT